MRSVVGIVGLAFVLCGFAFGQASNCPAIDVYGPPGPVDTGKKANFTVQVGSGEWDSRLTYLWSTSSGTISGGQGTRSIDVVVDLSLTVTVEIKGLPEGCPNQLSESLGPDDRVRAELLDEFMGSLDKVQKERFIAIVKAANHDPNAQLYAIISGGARNPGVSISRKRVVIVNQILKKLSDETRMTFVHSQKNDDRVVIWLVPPGANNPMP